MWLLSIMTLSHESCTMSLLQMAAPAESENFLLMFGTPALLWRVLHYAEYHKLPLYYWNEVYLEGQP